LPHGLITLLATLMLAGCGGGGGSDSSNEQPPPTSSSPPTSPAPPPPPPTKVNLALGAGVTELHEWQQDASAQLTVTLAEAQTEDVLVTFNSIGTATLGGDFDLIEHQARVPQGSTTTSLRILPIRDFEAEGDETIDIEIGTIQGNAQTGDTSSVSLTIIDEGALFEDAKDKIYGQLFIPPLDLFIGSEWIEFEVPVYNIGAAETASTQLSFGVRNSPNGEMLFVKSVDMPSVMPSYSVTPRFRVPFDELPGAGTYYASAWADLPTERSPGARAPQGLEGFIIEDDGNVRTRCPNLARNQSSGIDPLRAAQWNLENTGQKAYADNSGVEGQDLRMTDTLAGGPTGKGVHVAVVDTGMEICHPDLADNVAAGASFNFKRDDWLNSLATDPFLPSTYGDHGTSVAGIIGAVADNGIGLRGVAPDVRLRGYNSLAATNQATAIFDSLGGSGNLPDSSSVDIFNMSFGQFGREAVTESDDRALFQRGVRDLRSGRGAIYVKAAGNGFHRCQSMLRIDEITDHEADMTSDDDATPVYYSINGEIGCVSANSDYWNNLPYLITVGAFGADGKKSSYSVAGPTLWVSAPSGEGGFGQPAQITTDQMGKSQGYDVRSGTSRIPASENPQGDYVNSFNGTSAAAPNASGAIALLLEAQPKLTWRDVKHILARSARQIDTDIYEVKIGFGGEAAVLRHPWTVNAAGYHFHNWYGFGAIDVDAALALIATYTPDSLGAFSDGAEVFQVETPVDIPDHRGGGVRQSVSVSGINDALKVEGVVLNFEITHPFTNDLGIYLISPSGTESLLNPPFNEVLTANENLDWELLSNAFYGESPLGDWTLKVIDAAAGDVGRLESWSLTFYLGEIPPKS